MGIAPEVRDHIFEPFFTTMAPRKRPGPSLATVHGVVTQAGGLLRVERAPGRGANFNILLLRVDEARV